MPSGYANQDQAYILPSYGLNDAQKLGAIQNTNQLNEQKQQRLYDQQQRQEGKNLNTISDELNFDKYKTGEQAIDNYAQGQLQQIYGEALKNHVSDDPVVLEGWLQNQVQPLAKWHTMTQNAYQTVDKQLQDYNKTYPNIDYNKARGMVLNQFENDYLNPDGTRKNTDQIQPSDYNGLMQSPQFLGQVNNDQSAFSKFFTDIPRTAVGDKQYVNNKGHVKAFAWSGLMPEGVGEIGTNADNQPTDIRLRSDIVPSVADENGQPMRMLPNDVESRIMANPQAKAAALGMWEQAKPAIEQAYMQKTGQKALNPADENMLRSSFLYNRANQIIAHPLKTEEIQKEPKITINTGNSTANTGIYDAYNEINELGNRNPGKSLSFNELSNTSQAALTKDLVGKDKNLGVANLAITKDKNGDWQLSQVETEDNGKVNKIKDLYKITPYGMNSLVNTSVKQKQALIHNQQVQPSATPKQTYKAANGKNYTHKELLGLGYTEDQIQQAIKLGNLQ
jgi:hypothetical protein